MSFEPQTDVHIIVIPVDAHMNAAVTEAEATLLCVPDGANFQMELLGVSFRCNTVPADGSAVTVDIEWNDESGTPSSPTALKSAYDLTAATVLVNNQIWRGSQILDPGDAVNAAFTADAGLDTPSEGAALVVEYRVLRHS